MIQLIIDEAMPHISKATLILKGDADDCTLVILCDPKEKGAKINPITVKGTAKEVEENLSDAIKAVFTDNKEVLTNYKEVASEVKKATGKKSTLKDDEKKEEKKVETKPPAPVEKKEDDFKPNKDQKAVLKKAEEAIAKAEKTTDLDMVNYLENQYLKEYEKVAIPENLVKQFKDKFEEIRKAKGAEETEETSEGSEDGVKEKGAEQEDDLFTTPAPAAKTAAVKETPKKEEKKKEVKEPAKKKEEAAAPAATTEKKDEEEGEIIF